MIQDKVQKEERVDVLFSHTGERVSVHFSTRSSFLLDVACSSQSSLSLLSAAPAPSVSGQSPAPECQRSGASQWRTDTASGHREENIIGEEISSTLSLERHQSKPSNLELLRRFRYFYQFEEILSRSLAGDHNRKCIQY